MTNFIAYLNESKLAVEKKYSTSVNFYWGEYSPNIDNFHYHFVFASAESSYKVTVNSFDGGNEHKLIIRPWPSTFKTGLNPIKMPIGLSLEKAFKIAESRGTPNLDGAMVFLEDSISAKLGPGYWFSNENIANGWIVVSILDGNTVTLTQLQPITV